MKMLTIKQASSEVDSLSEYALRQIVKRRELPVVMAGVKVLINSQTLEKYLKGGTAKSKSDVMPFRQIIPV